ncbi:Uncharacterised protein [Mycobacteroides abscessus subsp. abscessus]|nr:Uncharacterised protein [Mycobacteroides abscessus subsp. abscessus]
MVPVGCERCGAQVLARKSSWQQTSVQWNADAESRCAQPADIVAQPLDPRICQLQAWHGHESVNRIVVASIPYRHACLAQRRRIGLALAAGRVIARRHHHCRWQPAQVGAQRSRVRVIA